MAFVLDAINKSIQVVLAGAVATNELQCVAHYADEDGATFVEGSNALNTNGTTAVTMVAAPAAATRRLVSDYSVYNADTVNATVSIQMDVGGTPYIIRNIVLQPGYTLRMDGVDEGAVTSALSGRIQLGHTASQTHAATATLQINWGAEDYKDASFYTHNTVLNPNEITLLKAGWYNFNYQVGFDSDYANRLAYLGFIALNGTAVTRSEGYDYSRDSDAARYATVNGSVDVSVAVNDIATMRTMVIDNGGGAWGDMQDTDTVLAGTWLTIQYLGV